MKMYALKNLDDNSVMIMKTAENPDKFLADLNAEMIGEMDPDNLPDRHFRNCWRKSGADSITINMTLARAQVMDEIRAKRDEHLVQSDAKQMEMMSKGEDTTALFALKQSLRDLPDNVNLTGLDSDELKAFDAFDGLDLTILG